MDCTDETIDLRTLLQHLDDPTKPLVTLPVDHDNVRREISTLVLRWLHDNGFMSTLLSFRDELQTKHRSEHLAQKLLLQLARAIEEGDWDLAYQLAKKTEAALNAATTHLQEQHQSLLQKPSTPPPQPQRPTTTNSTESLHPLHLVPNSHIPAQLAAATTTTSSGLPTAAVAAAAGSSAAGSNHSGSANSSFSATAGGDILGTTLMAGGRGGAAEEGALNKTTPTHHSGAAATAAAALAMQSGVGAVGGGSSVAPNNTNGGGGSSATPTGLTSPTPPPSAAAAATAVAPTSTAPPPASAGVNNNNSTTSSTTTNVTPNAVTTTTTTTTTTTSTSSGATTTTAPTAGGSASTPTAAAVNNSSAINKTNNSAASPPNNATPTTTTTSTAANGTVTWLLAQQQFFELVDEGDTTRAFAFFMRRLKPLESLVGIERFQVLTYLLTVKNLNEAAVRYPMLFAGWTPLSGRISLIQQIGQLLDATLNSPNAVSVLAGRWFRQRADSNLDPTTSSSSSFSVDPSRDPTSSNHHHSTTTVSLQTLFEQALSYQLLMLRAAKGGSGSGRNNNREEGEALEPKLQSPTVDVSGPGLTEATSVMRPLASQQPPSKVALRVTTTAGPLTAVEPLLDYGGVVLGTATGELRWGLLVQQNNTSSSSATTSVDYKGGPLVTLREQRLVQHFQPNSGTTRHEPLHHVRCLRTSATSSAAASKYRDTLFVSASGSSVLLGALPTTLWSRRVCKVGEFPSLPPLRPSGGDPFPSSSSSLIPFAELALPYEDDIRCALLTPCESFVICGTSAGDVILCDAQREEVALEGGNGGSGDDPALLDGSSSGRSSSHGSPHMARCRTPMRTVRLTLQRVDTFPRRANGTVRRALESVGTASLPAAGGSLSNSGSSGCACTGLQCNATGTTLFVSYVDGFVQAFNLVTGTCTLQVAPPTPSAAAGAIALGPSRAPYFSNFLFVPYRHNGVRVYDICTGAVTPLRLEGPPSTPTASRSSSSSYGPCAVTAEFSAPLSSPSSDRNATTTTDHSDPGHMFFLAGTDEGSLHVWSLLHPKHFTCGTTTTTSLGGVVRPVTTFHSLHQGPVTDVKVSNHCVVTVGLDGALCVCSP